MGTLLEQQLGVVEDRGQRVLHLVGEHVDQLGAVRRHRALLREVAGDLAPLEGGDHGALGLTRVQLEDPPLLGPGPRAVVGYVDREHPAQLTVRVGEQRAEQVVRVPGVRGVGDVEVRDPLVRRQVRALALVRHELEGAPVLGVLQLRQQRLDGCLDVAELLARLVVARDRDRVQHPVADHADRRHPEPRELGDALGDELQGGPVALARLHHAPAKPNRAPFGKPTR